VYEHTINWTDHTVNWIGVSLGWLLGFLDDHQDAFAFVFSAVLLGYFGYFGFYLSRFAYVEGKGIALRTIKEVRRLVTRIRHRIRKRVVGLVMPKWKATVVGDRLYDCLLDMEVQGILSKHDSRYIQIILAQELGLPELLPRRLHKAFVRAYFKGTTDKQGNPVSPPIYEKLAGPKPIAFNRGAGGTPSYHFPPVEPQPTYYKFLKRRDAA
jgi:hypothetical protein